MAPKRGRQAPRSIGIQLGNEIGGLIIRWGAIAAALTTIVVCVSFALPAFFRYYSSDAAPFEGKFEHSTDVVMKLAPILGAIQSASDAAQKAAIAADRSTAVAQTASIKEDQRDLCGLVERLANINMRLRDTPNDQFFLDAKGDRDREIAVLRGRIQSSGQLPEC